MPQHRTVTPGYTVIYPNRDKPASRTTKAIVILILLVSVALMLIVTVGGWSRRRRPRIMGRRGRGGTGLRASFRCSWAKARGGSSPSARMSVTSGCQAEKPT